MKMSMMPHARDPVMRAITGREDFDRPAASESQMGRFETGTLPSGKNLTALSNLNGKWLGRIQRLRKSPNLILDIDSSESPVPGEQEASAYNGHFGCRGYHPLFVFNQHGDLEHCALRPGNVHSAHNWQAVLDPVVKRYRWSGLWRNAHEAMRHSPSLSCSTIWKPISLARQSA
ncbi:transposase [Hoeflea sp. G2-23]|uniref:Transposase n=1 Tax=Hoeflea algicola TaxID=2983763 RepID=A0ABT3Z4K0_9HYPH|nr:transposase [Hoeflea algicola]MCY0146692.1 transposase [Hoeflea algicola]